MAKNKVSEYSSTAASNTDIGGIDIAENCAPSGINNAIRELMSQVKDMQTGTDGDNFSVGGNLSVTGTSTLTGAITATAGVTGNLTGNVTGNVAGNLISVTNTITADIFIVGNTYVIATLGSSPTDFTLIGASANTVGIEFVATGVGTGNGTATTVTGRAVTISSVLPVSKGGTGNSSLAPNAVAVAGATSTSAVSAVRPSTLGKVLTSTAGSTVTAGSFVIGIEYSILTVGTTDFTLIGASANTVGVVFTATGVGTGTGTAQITVWTSATPATINQLTLMTAQATTSGTSKDFTGIPSWVKRITVLFNAVSTNGTSPVQMQLGAGSIQTTGYVSATFSYHSSTSSGSTTGLICDQGASSGGAGASRNGFITICLLGSNIYLSSGILYTPNITPSAGKVTLSGAVDRLRITTINGTDTFDDGSINIMYE